ncbi:MAG TPA: hypothetical protein DDY13_07180 [Cytophagales bacterium]|jgi:hypothetical protein|nr:hypothetical protein [Cytophagales bacterium]
MRATFLHKIIIVLILVYQLPHDLRSQEPSKNEEWELQKESENIEIYTKWVETGEGRKARKMRAEMEVEVNAEVALKTLKSDQLSKKFVQRATEFYNFDFESENIWYTYSLMDIPWPLKDQELITRNELEKNTTGGFQIQLEGTPGKLPEKDNYDRIPHFEGYWEVNTLNENRVFIRYQLFTKKAPTLPHWIIDPLVEANLIKTFKEFRRILLQQAEVQ